MEVLIHLLQTVQVLAITTTDVTELVITSINDGQHMEGSRHYKNQAIDIRSKNFPNRDSKRQFRAKLEEMLGPGFRVLLENEGLDNEHFHAQVRKGVQIE